MHVPGDQDLAHAPRGLEGHDQGHIPEGQDQGQGGHEGQDPGAWSKVINRRENCCNISWMQVFTAHEAFDLVASFPELFHCKGRQKSAGVVNFLFGSGKKDYNLLVSMKNPYIPFNTRKIT